MLHQLDNGLRIILQENHSAPVVALQMWIHAGSAEDPQEMSGVAHVLEHMVFKGTYRRAEGQIAQEIESSGGQINAWTAFDQTVFHLVIASRFLERGLDVLADALQNARFDKEDMARELQVILEEIKQGEDSPSKVVSREMFATAYKRHPYGRPVIGRSDSVRNLTPKDVQQFFQSYYTPSNMTLVMIGDFDSQEALRRVQQHFVSKKGAGRRASKKLTPPERPTETPQRQMRTSIISRQVQEAYVSIAFHIPGLLHHDTTAIDLAAIILGQGDSSRLVRKIKHELHLVTDVYAYSYTPRDPGLLIIGATMPPEQVTKSTAAIVAQVLQLAAAEVSADELRRAKTIIESDAVYQKETVQGQARKLGFFQAVAGSIDFEQEYNRAVADTSAEQLREVVSKYFRPENLSVAVVAPVPRGREKQLALAIEDSVKKTSEKVKIAVSSTSKKDDVITKLTLDNGARLLVLADSSVPLVAMRAVWHGGLRYETEANNGINNLLAAAITRGTQTRSANQINESIEEMAGSVGGFSGHNSFGLRSELLARHWDRGLEILADCILQPAFREEEVERERRQVLDDIRAQQDNMSITTLNLFSRALYRQHPYRLDPLGNADTISRLTRQQIVDYYQKHFPVSEMVLTVVGDVDPEKVKHRFRQLFGAEPVKQTTGVQVPTEPQRSEPVEVQKTMNKQQAHLVVGFPGVSMRNKDRYVMEVMASLLSGQGGRLFLELRDRQGLAYQVGAYSMEGLEPGYFAVYMATSQEKIPLAQQGIKEELRKLKEKPVSAAELRRIKSYLVGSYEISLQRKSTLAALLAFNECYGLGYQEYRRYVPGVMAVTAADIQRVARKYLDEKKQVIAIVQPEDLSPGAAKNLAEKKQAGVVSASAALETEQKSKPRKPLSAR